MSDVNADEAWSRILGTDLAADPAALQAIAEAFDRPDWLTWWITTDSLARGGRKVAGPYVSQDAAIKARVALEQTSGTTTYWVDDEPVSVPGQEG